MTPKRVLEINGDLKESPLIETIRRIHSVFSKNGVSYTIIGGFDIRESLQIGYHLMSIFFHNLFSHSLMEVIMQHVTGIYRLLFCSG